MFTSKALNPDYIKNSFSSIIKYAWSIKLGIRLSFKKRSENMFKNTPDPPKWIKSKWLELPNVDNNMKLVDFFPLYFLFNNF